MRPLTSIGLDAGPYKQGSLSNSFFQRVQALAGQLMLMLEVAHERRQLRSLDDRMLKDIGLSRSDAEREAMRSILDLPDIRRGW